jgi:hypothetical protein
MDSTLTHPDDPTQPLVPFPDPTTSPAPPAAEVSAPAAAANACFTCGAALAADQRYCLVCGERNGDPRLPVMGGRDALGSPATPAATSVTTTSRGPRGSANTALIAGVGTLLVALGVGVVIGRSSDNSNNAKQPAQVITVGAPAAAAGGAAVAGATSGTAPGDTSGAAGTTAGGASSGKAKDAKGASGKSASAKAKGSGTAPASGKVAARKGSVVRLGQKGSGKGYTDGRFTGDFFGG